MSLLDFKGLSAKISSFVLPGLVALAIQPAKAQNCATPPNAIVAENCLTGNPESEWMISGAGDASIQGFATEMSVNRGESVSFKIKTTATSYRIDIYRIGYYGGNGARKITTFSPSASLPQTQPSCITEPSTGLIDCGNWGVSATWAVPSTAVSGLYIARLVRLDTGGASHIPFVVRNDSGFSDLLYQTSDTTWQAYNDYGGNSLYSGAPVGRAYKVSYNRPFATASSATGYGQHTFWTVNELPMIMWLERNGYNISYSSAIDTDRRGAELLEHKVFISSGHDEYWSGGQRTNVEAARDAGVNLAFFSADAVYWKTRWENSIAGTSTPYRTLVSYKETHAGAKIDPAAEWTGTWRDPRFSPPSDGGRPENALMGTLFMVNCCESQLLSVPAAMGKLRFWRNTSFASLSAGQVGTTITPIIGFEVDEAPDNDFTPAGLIRMSSTTWPVNQYLLDYGNTGGPGNPVHSLAFHKRSNGARVFSSGTNRWSWGLTGGNHYDGTSVADPNVQQATVNLFADMGVQPGSLQSGLVAAVQSTDSVKPSSTIQAPAANSTVSGMTTISGTASDTGGLVAAVEVSVDGGATWRQATGTTSWSYSWFPKTMGTVNIKTRATDDSGNTEVPGAGITVTATCPCTLFSSTSVPKVTADPDAYQLELGVQFRTTQSGYITGIRFYKGSGNDGTHVGNLWTLNGTKLASVTFTNETNTGWQQANFSAPVQVTANTTYVASYYLPVGHFSYDASYFGQPVISGPLRALSVSESGGNGVFFYGAGGGFPNSTYNGNNYWVDVVFSTSVANVAPVAVADSYSTTLNQTLVIPAAGVLANDTDANGNPLTAVKVTNPSSGTVTLASNGGFTYVPNSGFVGTDSFTYRANDGTLNSNTVTVTISVSATPVAANDTYFRTASSPLTIAGPGVLSNDTSPGGLTLTASKVSNPANGSVTLNTNGGFTYTPNANFVGTDSFTYRANNGTADSNVATVTICPCTLWPSTATPAFDSFTENWSLEIGVKFQVSQPGYITGIRFYKGALNTGAHVGNLWSSTGTKLATGTFTNETATGWQQLNFTTPVVVSPNTTYVASYYAPNGGYAYTPSYFSSSLTSGPLRALSATEDGGNGVFLYAAGGGFPTFTYNSTNYWVDVVFGTSGVNAAPVAVADSYSTPLNTQLTVAAPGVLSNDGDPNGDAITATKVANPSHGTVTLNANGSFTYVPTTGYAGADSFTYKATDGTLNSDVVTVNLSITTTPTAVNDIYYVAPGQTLTVAATGVLGNDTSPGGLTLTAIKLTNPANGSVTLNATGGFTYTPNVGFSGTDSFTYKVNNGNTDSNVATVTICGCTLWNSTAVPAVAAANEAYSLEIGVKFEATQAGYIKGIRFYKGSTNTGTHIGNLWSSTGTKLATATFTNESASGWQQVMFSAAVPVVPGTTYVASYYAPNGGYSYTPNFFTSAVTNGPLKAPSNSESGGNGLFLYGVNGGFPTYTYNNNNYWVDVVFSPIP